jgi:hypothetical protein
MRKQILLLATLLALPLGPAAAQTGAFRFRPDAVETGVVHHYLKTNLDGSHPEHVSLYVAAPDRIEAFKFHPKGERAGLVVATMDWQTSSAKRLESYQVFAGGEKKLFATLDYTPADRMLEMAVPPAGISGVKIEIKTAPWHLYNFDLASLNVAFRHLVDPKRPFTIGIADPVFGETLGIAYKGEATVAYAGDETRGGVAARKYTLTGAPFPQGVTIWVDAKKGHVVDIESPHADNPDWTSFKLKLEKTEKMSPDAWKAFQKAQF